METYFDFLTSTARSEIRSMLKNKKRASNYLTFLDNLLAIIDKIIANPLNVNNMRNTAKIRTPAIAATIRKNMRLIKPAPMPIPIKNLPTASRLDSQINNPPAITVKPPADARKYKIKKTITTKITQLAGGRATKDDHENYGNNLKNKYIGPKAYQT
jgi:hypothetical protein